MAGTTIYDGGGSNKASSSLSKDATSTSTKQAGGSFSGGAGAAISPGKAKDGQAGVGNDVRVGNAFDDGSEPRQPGQGKKSGGGGGLGGGNSGVFQQGPPSPLPSAVQGVVQPFAGAPKTGQIDPNLYGSPMMEQITGPGTASYNGGYPYGDSYMYYDPRVMSAFQPKNYRYLGGQSMFGAMYAPPPVAAPPGFGHVAARPYGPPAVPQDPALWGWEASQYVPPVTHTGQYIPPATPTGQYIPPATPTGQYVAPPPPPGSLNGLYGGAGGDISRMAPGYVPTGPSSVYGMATQDYDKTVAGVQDPSGNTVDDGSGGGGYGGGGGYSGGGGGSYGGGGYGGGGGGHGGPAAPTLPVGTPGADLADLMNDVVARAPGRYFDINPQLEEILSRRNLSDRFMSILQTLGFTGLGYRGVSGFETRWLAPSQFVMNGDISQMLAGLTDADQILLDLIIHRVFENDITNPNNPPAPLSPTGAPVENAPVEPPPPPPPVEEPVPVP